MAFYGTNLIELFNLTTNATYSQALSTSKKNQLLNEALVLTIQNEYRNGTISSYSSDLLKGIIKLGETISATNNEIDLTSYPFSHIMAVKLNIQDDTFTARVVGTTPSRITLSRSSTLRSTEKVIVANNSVTKTYYVKQLTSTIYEMYTDEMLSILATDVPVYTSDLTLERIVMVYAMITESQDKVGILSRPTINFPKYQMGNNKLSVNAGGSTVISGTLDYITTMPLAIDIANNTNDLLIYYPMELLYKVNDKAAELFATLTRDNVLFQTSVTEQQQNNK